MLLFQARSLFRFSLAILGGVVLVAQAGCGRAKQAQAPSTAALQQPKTKIAPPTPIDLKKEELGGVTWNTQWDPMIERALPPALLSARVGRDVRGFCPRFDRMSNADKRAFWAYFFQALAGAEAGLNPATNVRHLEPELAMRDSVTGEMIHSEGLLQLTYEDHVRYGCDFNWQADRKLSPQDPAKTILRPQNNLLCGVKILSNQLLVQRKPLLSPTSYWSTLRPGTPSYAVFAKQMTNPPPACGRRLAARPRVETAKHSLTSAESPGEVSLHP